MSSRCRLRVASGCKSNPYILPWRRSWSKHDQVLLDANNRFQKIHIQHNQSVLYVFMVSQLYGKNIFKNSRHLNLVFTEYSANSDTQWINKILHLVKKKRHSSLRFYEQCIKIKIKTPPLITLHCIQSYFKTLHSIFCYVHLCYTSCSGVYTEYFFKKHIMLWNSIKTA